MLLGAHVTAASLLRRRDVSAPVISGGFVFGYAQHGRDWLNGQCSTGEKQSPVDLPAPSPPQGEFFFDYSDTPAPYEILNTGHTIAMELHGVPEGGVLFSGVWYNLINVNVHMLSEHTFQGVSKQGELHLVHKRHNSGELLVVAIPIDCATPPMPPPQQAPSVYAPPPEGDAGFSPAVQALLRAKPPAPNDKVSMTALNAMPLGLNLLFDGGSFFRYWGSTTAPPCAEAVTWLVRTEAVTMSDAQAQYLHNALFKMTAGFGNNRAVMPFGQRAPVAVLTAVRQVVNPQPAAGFALHTPGPTQREIQTRQQAQDAMALAKAATEKVQRLDAAAKATAAVDVASMQALATR